jgi:hypothetical protein
LTILPLAALALLLPAQDQGGEWTSHPDKIASVSAFLSSRAVSWHDAFPQTIRWTEWDQNSIGVNHWRGIYHGSKLQADYTIYTGGVTRRAAEEGAAGHRGRLVNSGGRWLVVERPIPDEPGRPWAGVESSSCPVSQWTSTMLYGMRVPLYGMSVRQYFERRPVVRVREGAKVIEVEFTHDEMGAEYLATDRSHWLGGNIGIVVTFTRDSGWRPTVIRDIFALSAMEGTAGVDELEHIEFAGIEALALRTYTWSEWQALGEVWIPTRFEKNSSVGLGDGVGGLVPRQSLFVSELEAEVLPEPPAGTSFALVPPDWIGPVGRISNTDTGEVRVYDRRSLDERRDSQERFVDLLTESAGTSSAVSRGTASRAWAGWALLFLGSSLAGWTIRRLVVGRRREAV